MLELPILLPDVVSITKVNTSTIVESPDRRYMTDLEKQNLLTSQQKQGLVNGQETSLHKHSPEGVGILSGTGDPPTIPGLPDKTLYFQHEG